MCETNAPMTGLVEKSYSLGVLTFVETSANMGSEGYKDKTTLGEST